MAGSDAPCVLQLVEEALDFVAQCIEGGIDLALDAAIGFGGNDRVCAVHPAVFPYGIAVIPLVGQQHSGAGLCVLDQGIVGGRIMGFARREDEAERQTFAVCAGMDFTREAAARAAKTLAASPPLAPAA